MSEQQPLPIRPEVDVDPRPRTVEYPIEHAVRLYEQLERLLSASLTAQTIAPVGALARREETVLRLDVLVRPVRRTYKQYRMDTAEEIVLHEDALDVYLTHLSKSNLLGVGDHWSTDFKRFWFDDIPVTLDSYHDVGTWGVAVAILTGPPEFVMRLHEERQYGGYLPMGWKIEGETNRLLDHRGKHIHTPTEYELFEAIKLDWLDPWEREDAN